jgi:retron-type reverse transcriptase
MPLSLRSSWNAFRKGKTPKTLATFEYHLERNLQHLENDLAAGIYRHGPYLPISIIEKKRRDISVATVRDRIVHRWIHDYLYATWNPRFDFDVWSGRRGKGLGPCLRRTRHLLAKHPNTYIWRTDIKKFFDNVDHKILWESLSHTKMPQPMALATRTVIKSHNGRRGIGMPIGNLTSQIFSNIYLNEWDRHVRLHLRPIAYLRYGDDMILFARTRREAHHYRKQGTTFLKTHLKLHTNPKNDVVFASSQPVHFCGHVITKDYIVVDKTTTLRSLNKATLHNAASYKALKIAKLPKQEISWRLLDALQDIDSSHK